MRHPLAWLLLSLLVFAAEAQACSCGKRSVEQMFSEASNVFIGRVVSTMEIPSRADHPDRGGVAATFTLVKDIKGNARPRSTVQSGYGGSDCGVPLQVGTTYLFFVGERGEVNICSGTQGYVAGYEPHERLLKRLERLSSRPK